ncbi:hypothetical protein AB0D49_02760 [Streptomyces sp. NPDC048290]
MEISSAAAQDASSSAMDTTSAGRGLGWGCGVGSVTGMDAS